MSIVDASMIVNAFLTKCFVLSQRCSASAFAWGAWYAGSSMMKGGVSPRMVGLRMTMTAMTATAIPRMYMP